MTLPIDVKEPILLDFHNKLSQDGWNFQDCKLISFRLDPVEMLVMIFRP